MSTQRLPIDDSPTENLRPHSDNSLVIHGRVELIPNAVALHGVPHAYYKAGIMDAVVDEVWDTNMGGPYNGTPEHDTMQYFYLRGHEFGRACTARKMRVPLANIDFTFTIRGDA